MEPARILKSAMASEKPAVRAEQELYNDLVNLQVIVPCSTWAREEAIKCWGEDYATKSARGVIKTRQAEIAMLSESRDSKNVDDDDDSSAEIEMSVFTSENIVQDHLDRKMPATEKVDKPDTATTSKKRTKLKISKQGKRMKNTSTDVETRDTRSSDEESDDDMEEMEEPPDLLEDDIQDVDVQGNDIAHFDPHLWKLNELPDIHSSWALTKRGLGRLY